jgi:PGF-CTERM protein
VPSNLTATSGQSNATATPRVTPTSTPTPGFEVILALVGLIGFATLRSGLKSRK